MLLETYRNLKKYLYSEIIDIAIKQKISKKKQNNINHQYVKKLNNKTSLNKSILLKKKEGRL